MSDGLSGMARRLAAARPHMSARLRLLGLAITIGACFYVGAEIWSNATLRQLAQAPRELFVAVAGVAALYGLGVVALGVAFGLLIAGARTKPAFYKSVLIYCVAQAAKYLPTNVLHYLARHALLIRAGLDARTSLVASVGEVVLLIGAASVFCGLVGMDRLEAWILPGLPSWLVVVVVAAIVFAYVGYITRHFSAPGRGLAFGSAYLGAFAIHMAFFMLYGAIALLLAEAVETVAPPTDILTMTGIMGFAWLAGFLTPGASAGIGVREAVMITALRATVPEMDAPALAVLLRIVTTLGDVFVAALGACMLFPLWPRIFDGRAAAAQPHAHDQE